MTGDPLDLVGDEMWNQLGVELRRVDIARYLEVLNLVEEIVLSHEDPASPRLRCRRERFLTIATRKPK